LDALLASGTPADMDKYRSLRRKHPFCYADCWRGDAGDNGFDVEIIEARLAELRRMDTLHQSDIIRGYFKRENREVVWVTDPDGRFEMWRKLPQGNKNLKRQVPIYDPIKDMTVMHYTPMNGHSFICCGDTFGFDTLSIAKMREGRSRRSDGGIAVFWDYDAKNEQSQDMMSWDSYSFVLSYRYHPSLTDYQEDVLMTCEYFGAWFFPENNKDNLIQYFFEKGYAGYLLYDIDATTGKRKSKPGFFSLEASKNELFSQTKEYIRYRGHKEKFSSYLQECRDIRGVEDMKNYDRLTAHGGCLLGLRALRAMTPMNNEGVDLSKLSIFRKRTY